MDSLDTKHNIQQYNNLKPNNLVALSFIFFFASLSLSFFLTHRSINPKSIFPRTVDEHGGARGDIGGFMRRFDNRCPRGTLGTEYAAVDDARRRSGSHPFR